MGFSLEVLLSLSFYPKLISQVRVLSNPMEITHGGSWIASLLSALMGVSIFMPFSFGQVIAWKIEGLAPHSTEPDTTYGIRLQAKYLFWR